MYFPYLRGKQNELEALRDVNAGVYTNTRPIVEPVTLGAARLLNYQSLAQQDIPFILITNPYHPVSGPVGDASIQSLITTQLSSSTALTLGFLIDRRINMANLNSFINSNPNRDKVLIFRYSPLPNNIISGIQSIANQASYLVFDEDKTDLNLRNSFNTHPNRVLLTDGFQREDANALYAPVSTFQSLFQTYQNSGWAGIGDYLTIGDHFKEGGGQAMVVTLHITKETPNGIVTHHFSSTSNSSSRGLAGLKFSEANSALVNSPNTVTLASSGLALYRHWDNISHFPGLGLPKKASIMHHIELMSSLV